jgi:hypothetical protein
MKYPSNLMKVTICPWAVKFDQKKVLDYIGCFSPEEKGAECEQLFVIKVVKCKQIVIWLPYKILNHYNSTICQKKK